MARTDIHLTRVGRAGVIAQTGHDNIVFFRHDRIVKRQVDYGASYQAFEGVVVNVESMYRHKFLLVNGQCEVEV